MQRFPVPSGPQRVAPRVGSPAIDEWARTDLIRWLAIGSIAGQAIWLVVAVLGGLLEPGYSLVRDAVSVLGARDAAHPWLLDVGVAIWGVAFLLAALALCSTRPPACADRVAGSAPA